MNKDLEIIKVNYGEKMAQFCREQFPELLEEKDLLSQIMLTTFTLVPSHTLYDDILANNFVEEFKSYIYHIAMQTKKMKDKEFERPEVLLRKAGYTLYQCRI